MTELYVPELIFPEVGRAHAVTTLPDGTRIAWDMCGGCLLHISVCHHDIPIEPAYLTRFRTGVEPTGYADAGTAVSSAIRRSAPTKISGQGVPAPKSMSISDFVDAGVVAKVKAAVQERDGQ